MSAIGLFGTNYSRYTIASRTQVLEGVLNAKTAAIVLAFHMEVTRLLNFEIALLFYRDKLPKFNNGGKMVFQCREWLEDKVTPKVHPTQKPVPLLESLISLYTDIDDVVIDCCAGSGTTLLASANLGRKAYGFELKREFVKAFYDKILPCKQEDMFVQAEREEKKMRQMELFGA